jgi:hypothetical protein
MPTTPYMGLDLPVPTVTIGPAYASMIVTAFEAIDEHDHTSGKGAQVPAAGININADLSFSGFSASSLKSLRFSDLSVALSDPSDLNCLYNVNGNLYYNDGAGNQIQITAGGGLNASSVGGIGGDYATSSASLFYTDATKTFTFWQAASTPALIDCGDITIRETVASAEGITIKSPTSLAASYTLTLPGALPASTKILSVSAAGIVSSAYDVDNSTIEVNSNTLRLKDLGVSTSKIADGAITSPKVVGLNYQITAALSPTFITSTTYVDVTGAVVTITTSGRPVVVTFQPDSAVGSLTVVCISSQTVAQGFMRLLRDTGSGYVAVAEWEIIQVNSVSGSTSLGFPGSAVEFIDLTVPAGTVSYKMEYRVGGTNMRFFVSALRFMAYEKF